MTLKKQREEDILLSLRNCSFLTQKQIQSLHNLGSDRNANRVINNMSEYLHSFRHGLEKMYYLSKDGRDRIGCTKQVKKTINAQHYHLRNQFYIYLNCPSTWKNEVKIKAGRESLIADAVYQSKQGHVFVEVDVTQPMAANARKIEKYKRLRELTGQDFYLVFVTQLTSRAIRLNSLMQGLSGKVYTFNEIR